MHATAQVRVEVRKTLDTFAESYSHKNPDELLSSFSHDPDVSVVGTGADETRIGFGAIRAQIERDLGQADSISFEFNDVHVSSSGDVAWALADARVHAEAAGEIFDLPVRATFVLEHRDDRWEVQHMHASTPMPGQDEGMSFPNAG